MRYKSKKKMLEIKETIEKLILENQNTPTIADIAAEVNSSPSTVHSYLLEMNELGMIHYGRRVMETDITHKFSFESNPTKRYSNGVSCGESIEEEGSILEYVNLPSSIFGNGELFILNASGDSMEDVGVHDGDLIVVRRQEYANIGDIIVALDEDNANNLKEYGGIDRKTGKAILLYRNEAVYRDKRILTNLKVIQGVATHIIKSL